MTSQVGRQDARFQELSTRVVDPIFEGLKPSKPKDPSIPGIVFRNRFGRAQRRISQALESRGTAAVSEDLKQRIEILARRWAEEDFDDGFDEAEKFEIEAARERERILAELTGRPEEILAVEERAHRRWIIDTYGSIELRGLQLSERVYQSLEIAYVPLHVEDPSGEVLRGPEGLELPFRRRVEVPKALAEHHHLLVVGAPGSGKSTLVAFLAASAAHGILSRDFGWPEDPLPFVVPVRSLRRYRLDAETVAEVNDCSPELVRSIIQKGRALLLVDGLDEADPGNALRLQEAYMRLVSEQPDNVVLVTTRPTAKPEPDLTPFASTVLVPMTRDEVGKFVEKWCLAAELSIQKERHLAEEEAGRAAEDLKSRLRSSRAIERLAETPLLCTIICVVHRFLGQGIPERRVALYEACTNVLLYEWDRAKFPGGAKIGELDATAKRSLLGSLALHMHSRRVSEIPAREVAEQLSRRLPALDRPPGDAEQILAEIRDRSGLLVEKRMGAYAFSHQSFQEYLAAAECVSKSAIDELVQRHEDPWWHEVIVLAAGFPGFPTDRLVRRLLAADGREVGTGTLLAAQCVETAVELEAGLRKRVEKRVSRLVPPKTGEDALRLMKMGQLTGPALAAALEDAETEEKLLSAIILTRTTFEPSIEKLIRLIKDPTRVELRTESNSRKAPVGDWVLVHLLSMASRSDIAFEALSSSSQDPAILAKIRNSANAPIDNPTVEVAKKLLQAQSA
ncbi:MAG: NACHT domain-containing protein [bacterium]|nr:NACHT domain-containing protein [bacterium]